MRSKICFFDDYFIASRQGTLRRYFRPEKIGELDDKGYQFQLYSSFFYDKKVGKYRAYYEVPSPNFNDLEIRDVRLAEADTPEDFVKGNFTSQFINGFKNGSHGICVIYNPDDDIYVLVGDSDFTNPDPIHPNSHGCALLSCMTSKDGINFSDEHIICNVHSDTYNCICYNPYTKEYVVTMRAVWGDRRVWYIKSKDLYTWTEPELLMFPYANDNSGMQYYALGISHCDGIFYGILWKYMTDLNKPDFTDMAGYMDNDLMYSIDGIHYNPTPLAPVCERPLPPEAGCKQMWLQKVEESNDGRTLIFGAAARVMHGADIDESKDDKMAVSVLYGIRKDGFCAIEGVTGSSEIYTKNLNIKGEEIYLNFNARCGKITYALVDDLGREIEGFAFADCVAFENEESVSKKLEWKNPDWNKVKNRRVRIALRFPGSLVYSISLDCGLWTMWPQEGINLPIKQK